MRKIKCPNCGNIQSFNYDFENCKCNNCGWTLSNDKNIGLMKHLSRIRITFIVCAILFVFVIISFRTRIQILQMISLPLLVLAVLYLGFLFTKKWK